jgi:hypothetical protein
MIDIEKCFRQPRMAKTKLIAIRVSSEVREKMRQKKLSPTLVFNEALRELGLR